MSVDVSANSIVIATVLLGTFVLIMNRARVVRVLLPPEANLISLPDERHRVLSRCNIDFLRIRSTWGLILGFSVGAGLYVLLLDSSLSELVSCVIPAPVQGLPQRIIMYYACPVLVLLFLIFRRYRAFSRDYFREYLTGCGIPVCVLCGYDLRGQVDPRCPECGTEFALTGNGIGDPKCQS